MSEPKPTSVEKAWERAGYLAALAARVAADAARAAAYAALDNSEIPAADAAWERGWARWKADHPEARE
jgi:hypothetical protein